MVKLTKVLLITLNDAKYAKRIRRVIADNLDSSMDAYLYALQILDGPFPEGETLLAQSPRYAYPYALYALHDRFPLGEEEIARDPHYAYYYARDVIRGPWPEAEKTIATSEEDAYQYAWRLLKLPKDEAKVWGKEERFSRREGEHR